MQGFLRAADRELERHFTRKGGLYKSLEVVKQLEIGMRVWTEHDTVSNTALAASLMFTTLLTSLPLLHSPHSDLPAPP